MDNYEEVDSNEDDFPSREIIFPKGEKNRLIRKDTISYNSNFEIAKNDSPGVYSYLECIYKKLNAVKNLKNLNIEKRIDFKDIKFQRTLNFSTCEFDILAQIFFSLTVLTWALFPEALGKMKTNQNFVFLITQVAYEAAPKEIRSFDHISELNYFYNYIYFYH
jgi:hypothetical protein